MPEPLNASIRPRPRLHFLPIKRRFTRRGGESRPRRIHPHLPPLQHGGGAAGFPPGKGDSDEGDVKRELPRVVIRRGKRRRLLAVLPHPRPLLLRTGLLAGRIEPECNRLHAFCITNMAYSIHREFGGGVFQRAGAELHRWELGDLGRDGVVLLVLRLLHIEESAAEVLGVHALHLVV